MMKRTLVFFVLLIESTTLCRYKLSQEVRELITSHTLPSELTSYDPLFGQVLIENNYLINQYNNPPARTTDYRSLLIKKIFYYNDKAMILDRSNNFSNPTLLINGNNIQKIISIIGSPSDGKIENLQKILQLAHQEKLTETEGLPTDKRSQSRLRTYYIEQLGLQHCAIPELCILLANSFEQDKYPHTSMPISTSHILHASLFFGSTKSQSKKSIEFHSTTLEELKRYYTSLKCVYLPCFTTQLRTSLIQHIYDSKPLFKTLNSCSWPISVQKKQFIDCVENTLKNLVIYLFFNHSLNQIDVNLLLKAGGDEKLVTFFSQNSTLKSINSQSKRADWADIISNKSNVHYRKNGYEIVPGLKNYEALIQHLFNKETVDLLVDTINKLCDRSIKISKTIDPIPKKTRKNKSDLFGTVQLVEKNTQFNLNFIHNAMPLLLHANCRYTSKNKPQNANTNHIYFALRNYVKQGGQTDKDSLALLSLEANSVTQRFCSPTIQVPSSFNDLIELIQLYGAWIYGAIQYPDLAFKIWQCKSNLNQILQPFIEKEIKDNE